jgi:hypothetical protein
MNSGQASRWDALQARNSHCMCPGAPELSRDTMSSNGSRVRQSTESKKLI